MLTVRFAQIVSRNMTNLTPAQLEQFEGTFRYFDRDETNTLELAEMTAALASLGIIFSVSLEVLPMPFCGLKRQLFASQDEDMHLIYEQLVIDYGAVTYEAFINLLVRALLCGLRTSPDGPRRSISRRTRRPPNSYASRSVGLQQTR